MGLILGGHIHRAVSSAGVVTLSGTSGSPNLSSDVENSPTNALAGWRFLGTGGVSRILADTWQAFNAGTEWIDVYDANHWIRATLDAGDAPTSGPTLNSWHQLNITNEWLWLENSDPFNEATTAGTLQIDISSSGSGTPILDTGFYRGSATQFGTA